MGIKNNNNKKIVNDGTISCTFTKFSLDETNYLVNEWIDFWFIQMAQVEMKENFGPIVPFIWMLRISKACLETNRRFEGSLFLDMHFHKW
jgi:hypothetical protein